MKSPVASYLLLATLITCQHAKPISAADKTNTCEAGYFCPAGSTNSRAMACGGEEVFCPAGSNVPIVAQAGHYTTGGANSLHQISAVLCEPGNYCQDGIKHPCPAGRYGLEPGLSDKLCSAPCPIGYYCPPGSAEPRPCRAGRYGSEFGLSVPECSGRCEPGHYCPSASDNSTSQLCPGGRLGNSAGLTTDSCSHDCDDQNDINKWTVNIADADAVALDGLAEPLARGLFCVPSVCPVGFYCPAGAADAIECGAASRYCPEGSSVYQTVDTGFYSATLDTETEAANFNRMELQVECEVGHYCVDGIKVPCPAGTYGESLGLSSSACSGLCMKGFYCPEATVHPHTYRCGGPDVFCALASSTPTAVNEGFYSTSGTVTTRSNQTQCELGNYCKDGVKKACPPGTYGNETGLYTSECSGLCSAGFYCPAQSISAEQNVCATDPDELDSVFCPIGSGAPRLVAPGYLAVGETLVNTYSAQARCADDQELKAGMKCLPVGAASATDSDVVAQAYYTN